MAHPTVESFLASDQWPRSTWVYERGRQTRVYLRQAKRVLGNHARRVVDLASVEIRPQRAGHFKDLLVRIEAHATACGYDAIYVENVLNEHLDAYLERLGYIPKYDLGSVVSRWKPLRLLEGDRAPA